MDGPGIEREYNTRHELPGMFLFAMGAIVLNGLFQLTRDTDAVPLWVRVGVVVCVVAAFAWLAPHLRRGRTRVRADGVRVRGALAERHWTWHDIYDLRVEDTSRASTACLYDTVGHRSVLPCLGNGNPDAARTEVAELRTAAARHRGAAFERQPAVEALIRKRAGHRKAWERAATGAVVTLMCTFLTWVVLMFTSDEPSMLVYFVYVPLAAFALLAALFHWHARRP